MSVPVYIRFGAVVLLVIILAVAFASRETRVKSAGGISSSPIGSSSDEDTPLSSTVLLPDPSPTPDITHNVVASYYDVQDFPSARLLLNNKDIVEREIRPTLYSLDGIPFEPPPVLVGPKSFRIIDLHEWANLGGEPFRRGSIRLFHTGKDLIIGSQVYLEDAANSLSFEERLAELGKFDSRRLEGIWYMPRNQTQVTIFFPIHRLRFFRSTPG